MTKTQTHSTMVYCGPPMPICKKFICLFRTICAFQLIFEGLDTFRSFSVYGEGRLKRLCLFALMSVTLVVFLRFADNHSPFHLSYNGRQLYILNNYQNISEQIARRAKLAELKENYDSFNDNAHAFSVRESITTVLNTLLHDSNAAFNDSSQTFTDSPTTDSEKRDRLEGDADILKTARAPFNEIRPVQLPKKFQDPSFVKNLDLMKVEPFEFLPEYKNPCWKATDSRLPIACLPYFYLVGAPKSGTTDVFSRLQAHPDFTTPRQKEPHWITRKRFDSPLKSNIGYYIGHYFTKTAMAIYSRKDKSNYHRKITGDCSCSTFFDNYRWRWLPYHNSSAEEPVLTNADFIRHLNPDVRIIAILREPIDRLYSDFLFFKRKHDSPEDFHEAVKQTLAWFNQCRQKRSLRSCVYDENGNSLPVRLLIGIYHVHLKEFFRVFPRERVMVVKLEEYSKDPATAMDSIFRFLGLSETAKLRKDTNSTQHANTRHKDDREKGGMWEITRFLLQDFHRPHNYELYKLLNDENFNFNDMYS